MKVLSEIGRCLVQLFVLLVTVDPICLSNGVQKKLINHFLDFITVSIKSGKQNGAISVNFI